MSPPSVKTAAPRFVLLRDAGMTDLRQVLQSLKSDADRCRLAVALGRELARLHEAGFDHRDLFAKRILAAREGMTWRFCLLDWRHTLSASNGLEPARHSGPSLTPPCPDLLAGPRLRLRCLRAYLHALSPRTERAAACSLRAANSTIQRAPAKSQHPRDRPNADPRGPTAICGVLRRPATRRALVLEQLGHRLPTGWHNSSKAKALPISP